MQPAEQESLLLRQVAALRRSGLAHDRALEQAAAGLPAGPLADRVRAAQLALRTGDQRGADPLLAQGDVPVACLDLAARALDASQAADAALSMARVYLTVGLVGPLLLGGALAWLPTLRLPEDVFWMARAQPGGWLLLAGLKAALQYLGLPAALGLGWLIWRRLGAHAPGVPQIRRAAALLRAAAAQSDPLALVDAPAEQLYLRARRPAVGASAAAAELAAELAREGAARVAVLRHAAPPLAAALGIVLLLPLLAMFFLPLFSMAGGL